MTRSATDSTRTRPVSNGVKTTVMFKTDKKLKEAAQQVAKKMGVPFSAVLNQFLRDIVARKEILFIAKDEKCEV